MAAPIAEDVINDILKTKAFKTSLTQALTKLASRCNQNNNTGGIDCNNRNVGDAGYKAHIKRLAWETKVLENAKIEVDKFIDHLCNSSLIDNNTLFDNCRDMVADPNNETILDFIVNNPDFFYNYLNIDNAERN